MDVMFVDEAGQMSSANVLALSPAATSIVLLGDPQQLDPRCSWESGCTSTVGLLFAASNLVLC